MLVVEHIFNNTIEYRYERGVLLYRVVCLFYGFLWLYPSPRSQSTSVYITSISLHIANINGLFASRPRIPDGLAGCVSMTDISTILPHFPIGQYANLVPALEKHHVVTSDLLTLDIADLGKRTQLPLLDIKRLCNAVVEALHRDLGVAPGSVEGSASGLKTDGPDNRQPAKARSPKPNLQLRNSHHTLASKWRSISTLDPEMDRALGGGIPTGYISEITGESGAGKTQFLFSLLLAVQLPPPLGLGRPAMYISTEAALNTRRLLQILANNPVLQKASTDGCRPSLDGVLSVKTPDLEVQDQILHYQVPVEVERRNIGIIVLDSVAANYRAEFERGTSTRQSGGSNMAARSNHLVRLGMLLRNLAQKYNLAVVVSNQVADRFASVNSPAVPVWRQPVSHLPLQSQESPLASRSRPVAASAAADRRPFSAPLSSPTPGTLPGSGMAEPPPSLFAPPPPPPPHDMPAAGLGPPALLLDHQQRWFTGWGDDPDPSSFLSSGSSSLKTPSLGLVWSTQLAVRIALLRRPLYRTSRVDEDDASVIRSWRRWMKVVFAPHAPSSGAGVEGAVEFEILAAGLQGLKKDSRGKGKKERDEK